MCEKSNSSSLYPAGHIKYSFKTYLTHDAILSFEIGYPNVTAVTFEKKTSDDDYDPDWLMTIHFGPVCSIEEIQRLGGMWKESIFDILSLTANTRITDVKLVDFVLVPRSGGGGILRGLAPVPSCEMSGRIPSPRLTSDVIATLRDHLMDITTVNCKHLIRLFRYAVCSDDPVVQFILLYLILSEIHGKQPAIDKYIMDIRPATPQGPSPHNGRLETTYTRLRNQIAHRGGIDPDVTRAEIVNELDGFRLIVHNALCSTLGVAKSGKGG